MGATTHVPTFILDSTTDYHILYEKKYVAHKTTKNKIHYIV